MRYILPLPLRDTGGSESIRPTPCAGPMFSASFCLVVFLYASFSTWTSVMAQENWSVQSGDWSVGANWGGKLPGSGDTAQIANGGTATITLPGATCDVLGVGGAQSGSLQMTSGSLYAFEAEDIGSETTGTFSQSGGTNMAASINMAGNASGYYILSGTGLLTVNGTEQLGDYGGGSGVGTEALLKLAELIMSQVNFTSEAAQPALRLALII